MRIMTGAARIAAGNALQMTVNMIEGFQHVPMTSETDADARRFSMTGPAVALGEGRMFHLAQQGTSLAPMGMMATQAVEGP